MSTIPADIVCSFAVVIANRDDKISYRSSALSCTGTQLSFPTCSKAGKTCTVMSALHLTIRSKTPNAELEIRKRREVGAGEEEEGEGEGGGGVSGGLQLISKSKF